MYVHTTFIQYENLAFDFPYLVNLGIAVHAGSPDLELG